MSCGHTGHGRSSHMENSFSIPHAGPERGLVWQVLWGCRFRAVCSFPACRVGSQVLPPASCSAQTSLPLLLPPLLPALHLYSFLNSTPLGDQEFSLWPPSEFRTRNGHSAASSAIPTSHSLLSRVTSTARCSYSEALWHPLRSHHAQGGFTSRLFTPPSPVSRSP